MGLTYVAGRAKDGTNRPSRRQSGRFRLRSGWLSLALLVAVPAGLTAFTPSPALAQQADVYSASGITVDLTGDIATLRDQALQQGQRLALQKVLSDIAPPDKVSGIALPDDATIGRWVQDFQIEDEKASATHYIGRFTFRFAAQPIRDFLAEKGIDFAQAPAKKMLVVPIFTDETGTSVLWSPNNQWLHAWSTRPSADGLVPIVAPNGDLDDSNAITATQALAGDQGRLSALAVTQYSVDGTKTYKDSITGDANSVDQMMAEGVDHVSGLVGQSWKSQNLLNPNQQNELTLEVPLDNLKQWIEVKKRLAGVNLLRGVRLVSLKPSEAVLDITYLGAADQLTRSLAQNGLTLTDTGGDTGTLSLATNTAPAPDQPQPAPGAAAPAAPAPGDQPAVSDQPAVPQ
jgi:hypothetical protein